MQAFGIWFIRNKFILNDCQQPMVACETAQHNPLILYNNSIFNIIRDTFAIQKTFAKKRKEKNSTARQMDSIRSL